MIFHRVIDTFTDQHPAVRTSIQRVRGETGRYAPVVVDIYYDLLLAETWADYVQVTFDEVQHTIYRLLLDQLSVVPEELHPRIRDMVGHQWLESYTHPAGIADVFRRMQHRASRPEILHGSLRVLQAHHAGLSRDFEDFFPELIRETRSHLPVEKHPWLIGDRLRG